MRIDTLLCSAALLLLAACGPSTLQLNVRSPPGTNQGRPLYMLVRKVDAKQYAVESYGEVAAQAFQTDSNVLLSELIYPGTLQRIKVKVPEETPLAVSFLFTAPDGTWQTFVNAPVPGSLNIELLEGRIRTGATAPEPPKEAADQPPPEAEPEAKK